MDNRSLQKDEIEALSAIFNDDWSVEDLENNVYSIRLSSENMPERIILLYLRLPTGYPTSEPPTYTLSAPWMSRGDKVRMTKELDEVYNGQEGECILYLAIQKVRDFLEVDQDNIENKTPIEDKEDQLDVDFETKYHSCNRGHRNSDGHNENITLYHGEPITDRRSAFQAHLAQVYCEQQVEEAINMLKTQAESATHNISAYRISGGPHNSCFQDCDDDGENHAGSRLLHLLEILDVKNVLVVVSRWYGGIKLGADRFKHINNTARQLLKQCHYIDCKEVDQQVGRKKKSK